MPIAGATTNLLLPNTRVSLIRKLATAASLAWTHSRQQRLQDLQAKLHGRFRGSKGAPIGTVVNMATGREIPELH